MPVAAARLAEVVAGHARPVEGRRGGQHLRAAARDFAASLGALAEGQPRLGEPLGKTVAQPLKLAEAEHPGSPAGAATRCSTATRPKPRRGAPASSKLEAGDLAPQLGAGWALVDLDASAVEALLASGSGIGLAASVDHRGP